MWYHNRGQNELLQMSLDDIVDIYSFGQLFLMFAIKAKAGWSGKRKREWTARRGLQLLPVHFPTHLRELLVACLDVPDNRPDATKIS
jgi:hypothetical protein